MGLFDNFPWTNFHELNLDWIVKQIKEIQTALPEGLVGVIKGGTGADNPTDARANLGVYASEIDMAPDDSRVISLVMGYLEDQIEAVDGKVHYRIFKTVQDLNLTPGTVSLASTWTAMSAGDILICPPDELAPGACPESYGTLLLIRSGGNSGSCLFLGADHQYRMNFVSNYPSGSWEKVYTDSDIVPITNGGTGADNATDAIQNLGIDFSGTVLSVAHVGADLTGNVPLTASDLDVKLKLFTSITDLGLPSGSTLTAVWNILPANSRIVFPQSEISNPPVNAAGVIDMCKTGPDHDLGWVFYYGQQDQTYQMYLNSSGLPSGSWNLLPTKRDNLTLTYVYGETLTSNNSYAYRYGNMVIINLNLHYSTGFPIDTWTTIYTITPPPTETVQIRSYSIDRSYSIRVLNNGNVQVFSHTQSMNRPIMCEIVYVIA